MIWKELWDVHSLIIYSTLYVCCEIFGRWLLFSSFLVDDVFLNGSKLFTTASRRSQIIGGSGDFSLSIFCCVYTVLGSPEDWSLCFIYILITWTQHNHLLSVPPFLLLQNGAPISKYIFLKNILKIIALNIIWHFFSQSLPISLASSLRNKILLVL